MGTTMATQGKHYACRNLPELALLPNSALENFLSLSLSSGVNVLPKGLICEFDTVICDDRNRITAVQRQTDRVELLAPLCTASGDLKWFGQLLVAVPAALRATLNIACELGDDVPLRELAKRFPCCTVLLVQQLRFTERTEAALRSGDLSSLQADLSTALRDLQQPLLEKPAASEYSALCTLITLLVSQTNIAKALVEAAASESYDSLWSTWNSYTRHYRSADGVSVCCNKLEVPYGFTYYSGGILVATPLTHEVYRTSMAALEQGTIFLQGPPGTGKAETQKDFARFVLGRPTCVYNCAEWDTTMVQTVSKALHALPDTYFIFEYSNHLGSEAAMALLQTCITLGGSRSMSAAFTCNSGCKGGTPMPELPGVGPCIEMTVPQYAIITEVMLASEGFQQHSELAFELDGIRSWCREKLSKQNCYDFGLRAIKQVIKAAGAELHAAPTGSERAHVGHAFWMTVAPRCTPADLDLLEGRLKETWPTEEGTQSSQHFLRGLPLQKQRALARASTGEAMQCKLGQLLAMAEVRHGLAVLSEMPHEAVRALSTVAALSGVQMRYVGHQKATPLNNPNQRGEEQVMSMGELYGEFLEEGEWVDGLFTAALRMAVQEVGGPTWLVVDGDTDAVLMEPANSLLDDNKQLILESGEVIMLTPDVRVVYVVNAASVAVMSPANISRLGIVNMETPPVSSSWFW